jgi:hypothetical protein
MDRDIKILNYKLVLQLVLTAKRAKVSRLSRSAIKMVNRAKSQPRLKRTITTTTKEIQGK